MKKNHLIKNKDGFIDIPLGQAAMIAGLGLLIMTVFAVFPDFFIFQKFIVPEDPSGTAIAILANEMLFRIGICSYLFVILCDILVAWSLYVFLKPVNIGLSLLAAWFRLVYSVIFAVSLVNYLTALQLLTGPEFVPALETDPKSDQVMLLLNAFSDGWAIGFVFFSFHLLLLGYLVFKSAYIPKFLGVLLVLGGVGYLIYNVGKILLPQYDLELVTMIGWGELVFGIWLLIKGVRIKHSSLMVK